MSDSNKERSALGRAVDKAMVPVQVATSEPARRAYVGGLLLAVAACVIFGLSSVAFWLFYYGYVPQVGLERVVYLQFGRGSPYGTTSLSASLVSQQPYDVSVVLHMPRTQANLEAGNFMVDVALIAPGTPSKIPIELLPSAFGIENASMSVLARSRRPAILTHASNFVETAGVAASLPLLLVGLKKESEWLEIPMFEGVEFRRGNINVPDKAQVLIEADNKMQFYETTLKIKARFQGLRWFLYNHRIISYLIFTSSFFTVSMTATTLVYFFLASYITSPSEPTKEEPDIKEESDSSDEEDEQQLLNPLSTSDLSDTPRSFPSTGRRSGPLHFRQRSDEPRIKREPTEEEEIERTSRIQPLTGEADDEDEGETETTFRDSGIGTGVEDRGRGPGVRRRSSREQH